MVSASPTMMSELRKLRKMLHGMGMNIQAKWIPSAVNRFYNSLWRTWNPGDIRKSRRFLRFVCQQNHFDGPLFVLQPMGESVKAMLKKIKAQLEQHWNDGKDHLWNQSFDFIPLVLRKIKE